MESLLRVIPNDELIRQEEAEQSALDTQKEQILTSLAQYIMDRWDDAKKVKEPIEDAMLLARYQLDGEYDPVKLASIKEVGAPEVFSQITDVKARTCYAWVDENIIQQGRRIWSIEPTPIPDLPDHIKQKIQQEIIERTMTATQKLQEMMGQGIPQDKLKSIMKKIEETIMAESKQEYDREAKKMSGFMSDKIHDQLTEGGFYDALPTCIKDIIRCKAGFIKGPIFRKEKVKKINANPETGKLEKIIEERIIPTYERRSAFNIYPAPDSTGINDGDLLDVIYLSRRQLYDLIGLEGFDEKAIRSVLKDYDDGVMENWLYLDTDILSATGLDTDRIAGKLSGKIQCLEYWGEVVGSKLVDYGMTPEEIPDTDNSYPICAWVINGTVIKAMLNYDEFGKKPFSMTSFEKVPDQFWGKSLAEVIADPQQICNAATRALVYNLAMASGPQCEVDVDRITGGDNLSMIPWQVWKSTNEQMNSGPAIRYYQPKMVAGELLAVYTAFSRVADEHSGIPAFSHGSASIGGAGSTASGFQMLLNQSARGIKQLIKSIDIDILEPILERQYEYNIEQEDLYSLVSDFRIVALGYSMFTTRESQAMRKMELLPALNNPVDMQIIGLEGRKKLISDVFDSLGLDSYGIIPPDKPILDAPPPASQNMPPTAGPQTLDAAGNPVVGQDTRQFNPENPQGQVSTPGNPGTAQQPSPGQPVPGRAGGGPVTAGKPYMVGEKGPELIVPQQNGTVIPNKFSVDPNLDRMLREDGTHKGNGWLGPLPMRDNRTATELSIGVNIDGNEMLIPSIVPTLTIQEVNHLMEGKHPTPEIMQKAAKHAQERMKQGLSPFREE